MKKQEKSGDDLEVEKIAVMSESELLDYVMASPNYLTDSYYRRFALAIEERYEKLRG